MPEPLEQLKEELLACRLCADRFGFEPRPVFQGSTVAPILQVSQAPSLTVSRTGRPFDDASGRRLRGEWYQITDQVFYDPEKFYIASVGRCYPGRAPGGGDRLPPKVCAQTWLVRELPLVDFRLMILIGGAAAQFFFPGRDITSLVFQDHEILGRPAFVLPHPSPLNIKWFRDHPAFFEQRLPQIRQAVHGALGMEDL